MDQRTGKRRWRFKAKKAVLGSVYLHVYIHIYIYIYICIYVFICLIFSLSLYVYIYIYIYILCVGGPGWRPLLCRRGRQKFLRAGPRKGDDTIGNPGRAQISRFELSELFLLLTY